MDFEGTIDYPELGVQHEKNASNAYWRSFNVLRRYAKLNGFDERLNEILKQHDVDPNSIPAGDIPPILPGDEAIKLKRGVDAAQVALKREIENSTKGLEPLRVTRSYRFRLKNGNLADFDLDPDQTSRDTLRKFEDIIHGHASGAEIAAQFMPTFKSIRGEMLRWGWDKQQASPQATLLTIRRLCDTWAKMV